MKKYYLIFKLFFYIVEIYNVEIFFEIK